MNDAESTPLKAHVRVLQIIAGALLTGVLTFAGIAVVIRAQQAADAGGPERPAVLSVMAGFLLVANVTVAMALPGQMGRQQVRKLAAERPAAGEDDTGRLLAVYQTQMVMRLALLEGAGFLGCIAYLLEGRPPALGVVGVVVVLMLMSFPTADRVAAGLEELRRQLDEARHLKA